MTMEATERESGGVCFMICAECRKPAGRFTAYSNFGNPKALKVSTGVCSDACEVEWERKQRAIGAKAGSAEKGD
jgi:hypothetical protein